MDSGVIYNSIGSNIVWTLRNFKTNMCLIVKNDSGQSKLRCQSSFAISLMDRARMHRGRLLHEA